MSRPKTVFKFRCPAHVHAEPQRVWLTLFPERAGTAKVRRALPPDLGHLKLGS